MNKKKRIAVITSHPIQYQAPLFKKIVENGSLELNVYFCWDREGKSNSIDEEFGQSVKWDIPLITGYQSVFLRNYSPKPSSRFFGQINPGIVANIWKNKYDAVFVFGWNSFTNWLVFLTCFLLGTPVLLRGENPLNQEQFKAFWKIKIKKIVLGGLFRRISAFLYIGKENKEFYKFYGVDDKKLFFAPYAVDNGRFMVAGQRLRAEGKALREKMDISEDTVVILFSGKLISKKRPADLVRAFELLNDGHLIQDVTLLFVGDGELRPELEVYVSEKKIMNVKFLGFKNQTEMPEIYAVSDILVLPSETGETWGLAVNEAMCFGIVPVVSDAVGCGKDLVHQGTNGFVFKLGDVNGLSSYLSNLINNKERRSIFGNRSLEIVSEYNYDLDIEALLSAIQMICK